MLDTVEILKDFLEVLKPFYLTFLLVDYYEQLVLFKAGCSFVI